MERDEAHFNDQDGERFGPGGRSEVSRIHPLAEDDARIAPQPSVELTPADVERVNLRGPGLEEAVGEAAGAGPDVGADRTPDVEVEVLERGLELQTPARDVGHRLALEADGGVGGDAGSGLVDAPVVHDHLPGENQ